MKASASFKEFLSRIMIFRKVIRMAKVDLRATLALTHLESAGPGMPRNPLPLCTHLLYDLLGLLMNHLSKK